jgi:hypothetical protein
MLQLSTMKQRRAQGGFSMIGLAFWGVLLAMVIMVVLRVFTPVNEYLTLVRTIKQIKSDNPATAQEVQRSFEKFLRTEYGIQSIGAKDLDIEVNGGVTAISFAYDKEVPLAGPVFLLIKFRGTAR